MILHQSRDDFEEIILRVSALEGIRADVLEKDYYVTLMLEELSRMQQDTKAYFKGGTALYKALSAINRFSEDIDLTVDVDGFLTIDPLQRFGRVKIETTSFSVSEPVEPMFIAPAIYEFADDAAKEILHDQFNVKPFEILTIKLERIFVDKIFAAEFYYDRYRNPRADDANNYAFDVAKHIYDLILMYENEQIINMLRNSEQLQYLIALKRREEFSRKGGIPASTQINDFSYLRHLLDDERFHTEFSRMQDIYVFKNEHKFPLENAAGVIQAIRGIQEF